MWRSGANNGESIHLYRCQSGFPVAFELPLCVREAWAFAFCRWLFRAACGVWGGSGSLGNGSIGFYGAEEKDAGIVEGDGGFWWEKEVMA